MFKKISLTLTLSMLFGFSAYAEDPEIPEILTDPENGPVVWVSAETGIETIDGQRVWRDLSGNENHMEVHGSPQVKERAINQRPAMVLTASNTEQCFAVDFDETYVGDATIFIVANMKSYSEYKGFFSTSTPSNQKVLNTFETYFLYNKIETGSFNDNSEDINKDDMFDWQSGNIFGQYHNFIFTESTEHQGSGEYNTTINTYFGVYNKDNDTTTLAQYKNNRGISGSEGVYNTYVGLTLGSRYGFSGNTPEAEYAEAIMFTRELSRDEILQVSEYLSEKYFKPFPPTDGIEFNMSAEKEINGNTAEVTVSFEQIEGSAFSDEFFVVAQLYADEAMTMPRDIIVKRSTDDLTFNYDRALFAKIMAFSAYGADDTADIGTNIAHPIVQ